MADSGYSWVVLVAAFLINIHHSAGIATVGIFLLEFVDHFNVARSAATPIAGVFLCVGFIFGFPVGWLCRSYGCPPVAFAAGLLTSGSLILSSFASSITVLYFTYGCLASLGHSTFFITANIAIQQAFDKRRAFASGLAIGGVSVGVFVCPPLSRWAIDMYGWRGALILLAGLHLHSLVFAMLLCPAKVSAKNNNMKDIETEKQLQVPSPDRSNFQIEIPASDKGCDQFVKIVRDFTSPIREHPAFCGYLFGILFGNAGHIIPYSLLPTRAKALSIDQTLAATLVSIIGLSSGVARPVCGYIGDRKWVDRVLISGLSATVAGVLTALSFFLTSYLQIAVYSGLYGISSGAYIALQGTTVVDLVGLDKAAPGIGYLSTTIGLCHLFALTISGKLLDQFTDPAYTFLVFGMIQALGGIIIIMTMVMRKCSQRTLKQQPIQLEQDT